MPPTLNPWEMETQGQLLDEMQSLYRCRSDNQLDVECQRYNMMYPENVGYLEPQYQYQYDPYAFQQHQYQPFYPQPFEIYPHSPHPVYEPSHESSNLRDTPLAFLSSNAAFSPPSDSLEQLLKEQEDMLRSHADELSKILIEQQVHVQLNSKESRNLVRLESMLQEVEILSHTTSTSFNTDLHSHESGCEIPSNLTPIQPSKSSLPPIPDLSTSKTDEEFILEELSEPLQLKTTSQGDEYDEEIELETPEEKTFVEDRASYRLEECAPTLSSETIPI